MERFILGCACPLEGNIVASYAFINPEQNPTGGPLLYRWYWFFDRGDWHFNSSFLVPGLCVLALASTEPARQSSSSRVSVLLFLEGLGFQRICFQSRFALLKLL